MEVPYKIWNFEKNKKRLFEELERAKYISWDLETSGLNSFEPNAYVASISLTTRFGTWVILLNHKDSPLFNKFKAQKRLVKKLHPIMKRKKLIAHNGKYDSLFIWSLFGKKWWIYDDTMLMHYMTNENEKRRGLKELSVNLLGDDPYDVPLEVKQGKAGTLKEHCDYAAKDSYFTRRLWKIFRKQLRAEPLTERVYRHLTMELSTLYTKAEYRGFPINVEKLKDGKEYWRERKERFDKELRELFPTPEDFGYKCKKTKQFIRGWNLNSPTQLARLLFGAASTKDKEGPPEHSLNLKPLDVTPTGKYSVNESVLQRLPHKVGRLILDYREAEKNLGTFIDSWNTKRVGTRVHPSFKVHGTVTGRPSCENPNLQQTPRDPRIRSIIQSDTKGWVLAEVDYSQAELRIAAELSQDPKLLMAYQTGVDVHSLTVEDIFGIAEPTSEERKKGKAINFGFIYGMWWIKFQIYARDNYGVTFTDREAKTIREKFFRLYYGLTPWHNKQKKLAKAQGYVMNLIGRKRRLPAARWNDNSPQFKECLRQAINSPVQSLASDMNLLGAIEIDKTIPECYCYIVGTVHDSILVMIKEEKLMEVAVKIKQILEKPKALLDIFKVELSVPIEVEIKVGPWSLGEELHV